MQHNNKSFQLESVSNHSIWINGTTGSGKTARLIEQFRTWSATTSSISWQIQPTCLFFAASSNNRLTLVDRITTATQGLYPFDSATPISFFENEVTLFWSLFRQQLRLKTQLPLRLRPEKEQELAMRLWRTEIESGRFRHRGISDSNLVNRTLGLLQLAAASGTPHEEIPLMLKQGLTEQEGTPELWDCMGELLERWWHWCLDRGLLTYSIITELYWRYLLPHPTYQKHLKQRYRMVLADDVDEYPAVMRSLFEFWLDQKIPVACTFNPAGGVRLGLRADPNHLAGLAERSRVITLEPATTNLGNGWAEVVVDSIREPLRLLQLPDTIQLIQSVSKAQLLRQTAEVIGAAIQSGEVKPQDVTIVAPGLDAITRYTLQEILGSKNIPLRSLNSQQSLISTSSVRALLSLMALVYPGLGHWIDRELVAEMLVVLSQRRIDPVRAGLLADHCFVPDVNSPHLLPATDFPRWDRLGYQATQAYNEFLQWFQQTQQAALSPVVLLDRAIQQFFGGGSDLAEDQLTILRQLTETAQHYWEVEARLQLSKPSRSNQPANQASNQLSVEALTNSVSQFIQLLRNGTITANPSPAPVIGEAHQAVTLATIYQYRAHRCYHRWQFWLDAGSPLWLTGSVTLFGAPLFLQGRPNRIWTAADALAANQDYLEREVTDLLSRATERVYLCHCELAINGQEQSGALMPLVNTAIPVAL